MSTSPLDDKSLSGIRILSELPAEEIARIESFCRWRRCKAGQMLVQAGSPSKEVFFITRGRVNIVNVSQSGKEVVYASLRDGQCFGELAAIDDQPRSASVVAAEPATIAILPAPRFIDLLQCQASVAFNVLKNLAQMVRLGDDRIMELTALAAAERVYAELLRMARPDAAVQGLWIVRPLPPLREIASRVSTTRETVARAMGQVYENELVKRKGRNLYIMNRDRLEALISQIKIEVARKAGA